MAKKKLTKTLWYGSEKDVDGNPIVPNIAPSVEKHLEGINEGEIYIHNDDANPSIFIRTNADKVVGIGGAEALSKHFLRKDKPDTAKEKITFEKGVEVGKYESGTLGTGGAVLVDEDGNSVAEFDYATFRKKVIFNNITVKELKHIGGEFILSPASMVCSRVEDTANGYKCYFNQKDYEGRQLFNEFEVGDQAKCQTFTLKKNTYYWRLVTEVGDNYIVLSKNDYDKSVPNDVPKEGDNISLLGNRNEIKRQKAIVISAFDEDAPSYKQYKGINSYSLEGCLVTKLSPNGNELTGKLNIETGSIGAGNLTDLPDEIFNSVHVGSVNLLLNSGFTGNYKSEELNSNESLASVSELYSKKLNHWNGNATINEDSESVSGYSAVLGTLSQSVKELIRGEQYVVSFKAKGTNLNVICGEFSIEQSLSTSYQKYSYKFQFEGSNTFSIYGDATVCDIKLERGTIETDWTPSPYDNNKSLSEFQSIKYMSDAIKNGSTSVLGGLILSSMMQLGNYKNGVMQKVNAGVNGIYNNDEDVAFWGGGTFKQAIKTVMKFSENPHYKPTEEEWADMANFVVSHGGDIFLRGYIYALGGFFRGTVDIANGKILLNEDGSGHFANGGVKWTKEGLFFRQSSDNIVWSGIEGVINYDNGTYFNIITGNNATPYILPTPIYDTFTIALKYFNPSRSGFPAILKANFRILTYNDGVADFTDVEYLTIERQGSIYELIYDKNINRWIYDKGDVQIVSHELFGDVAVLGKISVDLSVNSLSVNKLNIAGESGINETITISDSYSNHTLKFYCGVLVKYNSESKE